MVGNEPKKSPRHPPCEIAPFVMLQMDPGSDLLWAGGVPAEIQLFLLRNKNGRQRAKKIAPPPAFRNRTFCDVANGPRQRFAMGWGRACRDSAFSVEKQEWSATSQKNRPATRLPKSHLL